MDTAVNGRTLPTELMKHKVELFRTSTNPIFYKWGYDLIYYCNYILVGHLGFEPRLSWFLAMFLCQVGIVTHRLVTCQASDLNLLHGARK